MRNCTIAEGFKKRKKKKKERAFKIKLKITTIKQNILKCISAKQNKTKRTRQKIFSLKNTVILKGPLSIQTYGRAVIQYLAFLGTTALL